MAEIRFRFYSSDATDVTERLDHGSLDLAVLLTPVDATKYEYLSLPDSARWGLLLPESSVLAGKAGVEREIAHWAQIEIEQLHIAATYNVINGNPAAFLQSGLGVSADHG